MTNRSEFLKFKRYKYPRETLLSSIKINIHKISFTDFGQNERKNSEASVLTFAIVMHVRLNCAYITIKSNKIYLALIAEY